MAFYCRLSYNSNGWQIPSGHKGKSTNSNNHEFDYGFGFEEWLFNERRFNDGNGNTWHIGYVDPLRDFDPENQEKQDLVLYTLFNNGNGTNRFIVGKLSKEDWEFIDVNEYKLFVQNNPNHINLMREELREIMPNLRPNLVIHRFNQQLNMLDYQGNNNDEFRLFNIKILKNNLKPELIEVNDQTPCPDWHINQLQMFRLYNSQNFNHQKCK